MFGDQSSRLLRERWKNASLLAEELYAMLNDNIPLTQRAPLTIQLPEGDTRAPLTIKNWGDGPMVKFLGKNDEDKGSIDNNGDLVDPPVHGKKAQPKAGSAGSVSIDFEFFAGQVIGGSGSSYTVQLYPDGTTPIMESGVPKIFTVKQLQIDSSATIPVGTWTIVFLRKGQYYMQVPVWLGT